MNVNFLVLKDEDYWCELEKAYIELETALVNECKFTQEVEKVQSEIRKKLLESWDEDEDFFVSYEIQKNYFTCGGIYSRECFSKKYIDDVVRIISMSPYSQDWTHHVAVEIDEDPIFIGSFFIRNGNVYLSETTNSKDSSFLLWSNRH